MTRIKIKGRKHKVRKTKMEALVKLCISCFSFFLSKKLLSMVPNTFTILPPVLFNKVSDEVIYLVRDADKLANFYLLSRNFVKMEKLFFPLSLQADNDFVSSEQVRNAFMAHQAINKQDVRNCADQALMILACLFDVRYVSSFVLMSRWGVMDKLLAKMTKFWQAENAELFAGVIRDYLQEKQLQQI